MKPWHGIDGHVMADYYIEAMAARARHGDNDWPIGVAPNDETSINMFAAKRYVEDRVKAGTLTWADLIDEEVAEFHDAATTDDAYRELIQIAQLALAAAESIKRTQRRNWENRKTSHGGQRVTTAQPTGGVL